MVASSDKKDRVQKNTPMQFNLRIAKNTEESVYQFASKNPEQITQRINALYEEWDIERYLETNASILALVSLLLSFFTSYYWLILTLLVLVFLLQHTLQGWCPPVIVLRWLNVRNQKEINEEIYALKVLRGDFEWINKGKSPSEKADEALLAVRR